MRLLRVCPRSCIIDGAPLSVTLAGRYERVPYPRKGPMKTPRFSAVAFGMVLLVFATTHESARAQGYCMSFQVTGFGRSNGNLPPTDPVSGSIVWQASAIDSPIQRFVSVDLTLDGRAYSVNRLSYLEEDVNSYRWSWIGGSLSGANEIHNQTDDFFVAWDRNSLSPVGFAYSSAQRSGIWTVNVLDNPSSFTFFSITPVPEPSMVSFLTLLLPMFGVRHLLRDGRALSKTPQ